MHLCERLYIAGAIKWFNKCEHFIACWVSKKGFSINGGAVKSSRNRTNVEGRKEMFYLTTHSTHFIYGYVASDIW